MKRKFNSFHSWIIIFYVAIALAAPLLANERPLYISIQHQSFFPAFSSSELIQLPGMKESQPMNEVDWKNLPASSIVFAPVAYSPNTLDFNNSYQSPFDQQQFSATTNSKMPMKYRHWLGTNKLGQDVLAGIIYGTRTTLFIGIISIAIALLIGVSLGMSAGYFENHLLKISRLGGILFLINLIPAWFYAGIVFPKSMLAFTLLFFGLSIWPFFIQTKKATIALPVDRLLSSFIEIFISLPRLIILLVIAAVLGPSVKTLILIIGFTSWTEIARVVRLQVIQLKNSEFIQAAEIAGIPRYRIWYKHILRNMLDSLKVMSIYGIAAAVLAEASLSFIGAGTSPDVASWGKIMYDGRQNYQAWWSVLFPGFALFLLLYSLRKIIHVQKTLTLSRSVNS